MGYMGLGMQSWISKMKPRKFLGKRGKPDGGGGENPAGINVQDYYHLKPNNLETLLKKKYSVKYRNVLGKQLVREKRKQNGIFLLSLIIAIVIVVLLLAYLLKIFEFFSLSQL